MFKFSKQSLDNLVGVHPDLILVVHETLNSGHMDFRVGEGMRSIEKQKENIEKGVSWTMNSKHLVQPDGFAHAVDLYPSPIDMIAVQNGKWQEIIRFGVLAGIMKEIAKTHGIKIKWGCDWDGDGQTLDHTTWDAPHFEIVVGAK